MRAFIITVVVLIITCIGCTPPTVTNIYEGRWVDEAIPLTLDILEASGELYSYKLSSNEVQWLTGAFTGHPDGSVVFLYDDGGQRQISFIGFITGDTLTARLVHTGLYPSGCDVYMERI